MGRHQDLFFANFYTKERVKLIDRITEALLYFMDDRSAIKSSCHVKAD